MKKKLSANCVRRHRAKQLGLNGQTQDLLQIVDSNGGLHGTSFLTPYLSLIARGINKPFQLLNTVQLKERKLVRVRAMRGALFILPATRLPMILGAFKTRPRVTRKFFEQWGVDANSIGSDRSRLLKALSDRPHTLKELRDYLNDLAMQPLSGNRSERSTMLNFLLAMLQLEGLIISEKTVVENKVNTMHRYARVSTLYPDLPPSPDDQQCLVELIQWFFKTQGPANVDDLAWWSGLNKIPLKKTVATMDLMEVEVGENDRPMLVVPDQYDQIASIPDKPLPGVRLLPYEDPYLKGHKDRGLLLSGVPDPAIFSSGEARPSICTDGRVVGLWRFVEKGDDVHIGVEIFDKAAVDMDELNEAKEKAIKFVMAHFPKNLDNYAKGIMTGVEPYA